MAAATVDGDGRWTRGWEGGRGIAANGLAAAMCKQCARKASLHVVRMIVRGM